MYTIYMLLFQVKDHDLMWFGKKKSIFFGSFFPIWIPAQKACAQDLQPSSSQPIHWYLSFSIRVLPHGELSDTEHPAHICLFFIVLFGQAFMSDLSTRSDVLTNVFNFSFKSFFRMYFFPVFTVLVDFLVDFVLILMIMLANFLFYLLSVAMSLLTRQQMMALVHAFENLFLEMGFVFLIGLFIMDFWCWFSVKERWLSMHRVTRLHLMQMTVDNCESWLASLIL